MSTTLRHAPPRRVFLDTNVFVYVFDASAPRKQARARDFIKQCLAQGHGVIGHQVVQEFANVALHRMQRPMTADECTRTISELLLPMLRVGFSPELVQRALAIQHETRYHWYDSLMLAAALEARCDVFCSEDLNHGQAVRGMRIENPFLDTVHES